MFLIASKIDTRGGAEMLPSQTEEGPRIDRTLDLRTHQTKRRQGGNIASFSLGPIIPEDSSSVHLAPTLRQCNSGATQNTPRRCHDVILRVLHCAIQHVILRIGGVGEGAGRILERDREILFVERTEG